MMISLKTIWIKVGWDQNLKLIIEYLRLICKKINLMISFLKKINKNWTGIKKVAGLERQTSLLTSHLFISLSLFLSFITRRQNKT
jgi:hypothetical protein